jgi:hypothetical protein
MDDSRCKATTLPDSLGTLRQIVGYRLAGILSCSHGAFRHYRPRPGANIVANRIRIADSLRRTRSANNHSMATNASSLILIFSGRERSEVMLT